MNRMNKLNHFTTYDVLLKILKKGLKFSSAFDKWDDLNDSSLAKMYQEKHPEQRIGVICFLNDDETVYHWTYFAQNGSVRDICCIEFNKEKIVSKINSKKYFRGIVHYRDIDKVEFKTSRDLLFTKRQPYRNEKEYRIVNKKISETSEYLSVKDCLQKITMSGMLSFEEFCERRSYLERKYGLTCLINHSTVFENRKWINKAKKTPYNTIVKHTSDISRDCYLNIWALVENGGAVDMNYFDEIWNKHTIVGTLSIENKLTACGALKDVENSSHKESVFQKAESPDDYNDFKYELGWIVTAEEKQNNGFCGIVVDKLLEKNGSQPIYATVREDNCKMRTTLEKRGFCVSGHKYKSLQKDQNYYLFLYIRK